MQHELPLRLVEVIARAGSIRSAADYIAITPSALNRRLLAIEDELGTQLFERVAGGVILNAAGEIFLAHARQQLADMAAVRSKIEALKGIRRGRIVVAHDEAMAPSGTLARAMHDYRLSLPEVSFAVETCSAAQIPAALTEYSADLALQLHPQAHTSITSLAAAPAVIRVVLHEDHPLRRARVLRFHELIAHPWVLPPSGALREVLLSAMRRQGLEFRAPIEAELSFARAALLTEHAIGFEVDVATGGELWDGLARGRLAARDDPQLYIHLLQLKDRSLPVAAGRFAERVKVEFAGLLDADRAEAPANTL